MFKRYSLLLLLILALSMTPCAAEEIPPDNAGEELLSAAEEMPVALDSSLAILDDQADSLRAAQQSLSNLGYYNGAVDGVFGKQTEAAIRAFQRQSGLSETGHLDEYTDSLLTQYSSENINAKTIQQRLIDLGYLQGTADGKFGEKSARAMKVFQQINGLSITGAADAETIIHLFSDQVVTLPAGLSAGSKGEDVMMLQRNLIRYGFMTGESDGDYGKTTSKAVQSFQEHLIEQGIPVEKTGTASPLSIFCLCSEEYSSYLRDMSIDMTDSEVQRIELRLAALGDREAPADDTVDE